MIHPEPEYQIGQKVRVILNDRNRTPHEGVIERVVWHYKDGRYNYYLRDGNRKVSKRYFADDLQPMPDSPIQN